MKILKSLMLVGLVVIALGFSGCVALEKAVENNGITHASWLKVGLFVGQATDGRVTADVGFQRGDLTFIKDSETGQGSYEHKTLIGAQPGDIVDETTVILGETAVPELVE